MTRRSKAAPRGEGARKTLPDYSRPALLSLRAPEVLFLVVIFLTLATIKLVAHYRFGTSFDSALFGNVAWRLGNGLNSVSTLTGFPYFATHASGVILLLAPAYAAWPRLGLPMTFVFQAASIVLVGVGILAAADALGLRRRTRWLLLGLTLLSPGAFLAVRLDIHEPTLGLGFLSMTVASMVAGTRPARGWWWPLLAAACRIEMATATLVAGLFLRRRGSNSQMSGVTIGSGVAGILFSLWFLTRSGSDAVSVAAHFAHLGSSPGEVLATAFRDPVEVLRPLMSPQILTSLVFWLLPFGLVLPFLGGRFLLIALPLAGVALFGVWPPADLYPHHYWYGFLVGAPMAAAFAVSRYSRLLRILAIGGGLGLAVGWTGLAASDLNPFGRSDVAVYKEVVAVGLENPDSSLSVPDNAVPHLIDRRIVYEWPRPFLCSTSTVGPFDWIGIPPDLVVIKRSEAEAAEARPSVGSSLTSLYERTSRADLAVFVLTGPLGAELNCAPD